MMRRPAITAALGLIIPCSLHAQRSQTSGWPVYGATLSGQRFSSDTQITRGNVQHLKPAWVFHTHTFLTPSTIDYRASTEATPVLWSNTLFFDTPFNEVFALDAATGRQRWKFDPHVARTVDIYIAASRGVSLWHASRPKRGACNRDRVLVATVDRRLIALDAGSGRPCLGFGVSGTVDLLRGLKTAAARYLTYTSPPTVVGDTVVLGSTVADNQNVFAASGEVRAFDAVSGRQKWAWQPIPWASTKQPQTSGSANAWAPLSADPDHDLVFVPTGSASVDFFGGERPGENRDADSLVALRISTGERVWAFQFVHHDLWDYDTPSQPLLFTFRDATPAVAVTTKTSMVFVFNRLTGEPLYPVQERSVPSSHFRGESAWPTQPFSTLPSLTPLTFSMADLHMPTPADQQSCAKRLHALEYHGLFTPPSVGGSLIYPGNIGGANWGSSAFDAATSVLFTRVSSLPYVVQVYKRANTPNSDMEQFRRDHLPLWLGGLPPRLAQQFGTPDDGAAQRDEDRMEGTPYDLAREGLFTAHGVPCAPAPYGAIVALDLNSGRKLWTVPNGEMGESGPGSIGVGGVIATAGGLLFAASSNDSLLHAYDSSTGRMLWRGELPAPANATPMTYTAAGRQFVVIAAGGHGFLGGRKSDAVVAFALPSQSRTRIRLQH